MDKLRHVPQVGGVGGTIGPDLTYIGYRKSAEWLDMWLKNPAGWKKNTLMPNFYFKDRTRDALVAYLATLKGQDYKVKPWDDPSVSGDPVKRGESLFNHAGCVGCHGVKGQGGYNNNNVVGGLIPSLTMVSEGYSKEELAEKISKGVPHPAKDDPNGAEPMIHMPSWGEMLSKDEIESLVEYLYSLKPKSASSDGW